MSAGCDLNNAELGELSSERQFRKYAMNEQTMRYGKTPVNSGIKYEYFGDDHAVLVPSTNWMEQRSIARNLMAKAHRHDTDYIKTVMRFRTADQQHAALLTYHRIQGLLPYPSRTRVKKSRAGFSVPIIEWYLRMSK